MKRATARAALLAISALGSYAVLELALFPLLLPHVPLKLHAYLPQEVSVLAQSSKSGTTPRDYLGLAGDSYAMGLGDWVRSVDPNRNDPFHSAHVLHDLTGRDVISFGRGGAGSIAGVVADPLNALHDLHGSRRFPLEAPDVLIVYFYEGNDLYDNMMDLVRLSVLYDTPPGERAEVPDVWRLMSEDAPDIFKKASDPRMADDAFFAALIEIALEYAYPPARPEVPGFTRGLFAGRTAARAFSTEFAQWLGLRPIPAGWQLRDQPLENLARVGGAEVELPARLQGPAMNLSESEVELAVRTFDRALSYLKPLLPSTELCVVYLTSPLASYELLGEVASVQPMGEQVYFPVAEIGLRSARIRDLVRSSAERAGVRFVDSGPKVRELAQTILVHGPEDWRHFNREGYTALASAALACLP